MLFTQLCLTLCNPMDCSTPGFPVLHYLPEYVQTDVHWIGDTMQPSHPLSSSSPPAFNLSSIKVFCNKSALCSRWPKYWSFSFSTIPFNEYSGLISFIFFFWYYRFLFVCIIVLQCGKILQYSFRQLALK